MSAGGMFGDVQDMGTQNPSDLNASESGEDDASATSELRDSLQDIEIDITKLKLACPL